MKKFTDELMVMSVCDIPSKVWTHCGQLSSAMPTATSYAVGISFHEWQNRNSHTMYREM